MKTKLSKILNNKNAKIIIPSIVLLVLLIIVFIYLKEFKYNRYRNKQDDSFYQYLAGEKTEYEATISLNRDNEIKAFVPKGISIKFGSTPIYYKEEEKVIFPNEMNIVFPLKNKSQAKTKEFSYVKKVNNLYYLTFEDYKNNIDHFILHDGKNLYFFSDSVNFVIDNENIELSPLSYIVATQNELSYYDYEKDEFKTYDINKEILVTNKYYTLSVSYGYIDYSGSKLLLTSDLSYLSYLANEKK